LEKLLLKKSIADLVIQEHYEQRFLDLESGMQLKLNPYYPRFQVSPSLLGLKKGWVLGFPLGFLVLIL
jgi:hypothetical protein